MTEALRSRVADAVDILSDLDAWLEARGDRLPLTLRAKALAELETLAVQLSRLRHDLVTAENGPEAARHRPNASDAG